MKKGDIAWKVIDRETRMSCMYGLLPKRYQLIYLKGTYVRKPKGSLGILLFATKEQAINFIENGYPYNQSRAEIIQVKVSGRITKIRSIFGGDLTQKCAKKKFTYNEILNFALTPHTGLRSNNSTWHAPKGTYAVGQVEVLG
jgi:hypothetical protein